MYSYVLAVLSFLSPSRTNHHRKISGVVCGTPRVRLCSKACPSRHPGFDSPQPTYERRSPFFPLILYRGFTVEN
ncbi:hypothetical protein C8R47DRAFT_1154090 [Mycena vitilis]|nr:hypothetical protein C8R47DRAFT_1154090 [Mycena vitilis]